MRWGLAIIGMLLAGGGASADPVKLKEIFPFGTWLHGDYLTSRGVDHPTIAEDIAAMGCDFVCTIASTTVPAGSPDPTSVASVLQLAKKHRIRVLLSLSGLVTHPAAGTSPADLLRTGALRARLAPFVAEGRKHDSLLGWHIGDEPQGEASLKAAEEIRQVLAELDPGHPGWTETPWGVLERDVKPHLRILQQDVFQPEVYPLWNIPYHCGIGDFRFAGFLTPDKQKGQDDWITVELVEQYRQLRPLLQERHVWPWIQAFHEYNPAPAWCWRPPTPEEVRCLTWISVAEGCKGLCWFGYELPKAYGDLGRLAPEIRSLTEAIRPLTDVLLECSVAECIAQVSGGGSRYYEAGLVETLRDLSGMPHLAVVNRNCEARASLRVSVRPDAVPGSGPLLAVDPADNSILAAHHGRGPFSFALALRPGEGKLVRLVRAGASPPLAVTVKAGTVRVGESLRFEATGGVHGSTARPCYRWSVNNPSVGEIDPVSGRFEAKGPGPFAVLVRDMAGNVGMGEALGGLRVVE